MRKPPIRGPLKWRRLAQSAYLHSTAAVQAAVQAAAVQAV